MAPLLTSSVTLAGIASEPPRPVSGMLGLVLGIKGDPTGLEPGVELAFSKRLLKSRCSSEPQSPCLCSGPGGLEGGRWQGPRCP